MALGTSNHNGNTHIEVPIKSLYKRRAQDSTTTEHTCPDSSQVSRKHTDKHLQCVVSGAYCSITECCFG